LTVIRSYFSIYKSSFQLENSFMQWLTKKKTMLVGIDVTHPSPLSRKGTPSIAAVVASVDANFVQFPASLRIQQSKKEVSTLSDSDCHSMFADLRESIDVG
jgi:hypothetical protein